ncbi:competence protein ComEA helix-hairpin-helix repeat region [Pedobacter terrae]|uniref:Competence protein ComEA helix-hairpin-helix repeat region n=1 Tax=Pedobacter terrae TaxID=405671 RepID=A0A1G7ZGV8_9SPHI|nr:helix-hairpin-helix domain-containing protein [Pedobacter terrae]SDH07973.1 competence protein ComEA helix-hairpin-helix repeat region [Pedobacter terrae]
MRIWFNKNFGVSKSEFNGLLFLVAIILVIKAVPVIYGYYQPVQKDDPNLLAQIQQISIKDQAYDHAVRDRIEGSSYKKIGKLFKFNPNTLDKKGWETLGLSAKQAQSIVNYTAKGGRFYKAEDLQKMYTISPEMYKKMLTYVNIPDQPLKISKNDALSEKKEYVKKALVIVDINTADSTQLDEIKGIGGTFALRIIKYRERLGGFYKKEQLLEVYGLDSNKYAEIKDQIKIGNAPLKTININTATFNDLRRNPYLTFKQINAIIQYRRQHGSYTGVSDLKKIILLNQQVIDKITPYISF